MKKLQFAALLTLTGLGVLAQSAQAAVTTFNTGDLFLGFRQDNNTTADILIDLGPEANFRDNYPIGNLNSIIGTGLGSLLTSSFGSGWFTDTTVHWGIMGSSGATGVTVNGILENPNTLYISNPETNLTPPVSASSNTQNGVNNNVVTMKSQWIGKTVPTGLLNGFVETPSASSWAGFASAQFGDNGQFATFEDNPNVSSALDLYRLTRSSSTSSADGLKGTFTINSSGTVFYGTVPEPTTAVTLLGGAGMLLLSRRRRPITA